MSLVKKITRRLRFELLKFKVKDLDFNGVTSPTQFDLHVLESNKKKLEPYYIEYIQHVSSPEMAASLELATFIYTLCQVKQYKKLLDMGSGLSSFIFRLYAKETPGVIVYSVDDDAAWLEKTKAYLQQHNLATENMLTLQAFLGVKEPVFDCILHDMNFVEIRINYVELVVDRISQKGVIIMDDVHKPDYQYALLEKLSNLSVNTYTIKSVTLDSYGRYAFAVLKK